jgi:hypothetical protein
MMVMQEAYHAQERLQRTVVAQGEVVAQAVLVERHREVPRIPPATLVVLDAKEEAVRMAVREALQVPEARQAPALAHHIMAVHRAAAVLPDVCRRRVAVLFLAVEVAEEDIQRAPIPLETLLRE